MRKISIIPSIYKFQIWCLLKIKVVCFKIFLNKSIFGEVIDLCWFYDVYRVLFYTLTASCYEKEKIKQKKMNEFGQKFNNKKTQNKPYILEQKWIETESLLRAILMRLKKVK